ncbi:MAG: GNAT family N-acetyltransferase [Chromatiales bacterium]|jgi:predicted GNAT family N-acyltransferase
MIERYHIRIAHWPRDRELLRQVRKKVFIQEQRVPAALEWDGTDDHALHLLALDEAGRPIGTARLLPSGQIGRMAVLKPWRRRGVGSALLQHLLTEAAKGEWPDLFLNAQLNALAFYTRHGFHPQGEVFEEAGIPHRRMTRKPTHG